MHYHTKLSFNDNRYNKNKIMILDSTEVDIFAILEALLSRYYTL